MHPQKKQEKRMNPKTIPIYNPGSAPDFAPSYGQPEPYLTPFLLPGAGNICVMVCPGGGYIARCESYEGTEICEWLNRIGISAFMLSYRVAPYRQPVPQNDLSDAIRLIRANSSEYGIDPHRIGVLGFSAGGHLAASVLTHPERFERPDFGILCYAVISMSSDITHEGTRQALLGERAGDEALRDYYSAEKNVTDQTPPCFVWHTRTDEMVSYQNAVRFAEAMKQAGRNCELHLYPEGRHGLGLAQNTPGACEWPACCKNWIFNIGKEEPST